MVKRVANDATKLLQHLPLPDNERQERHEWWRTVGLSRRQKGQEAGNEWDRVSTEQSDAPNKRTSEIDRDHKVRLIVRECRLRNSPIPRTINHTGWRLQKLKHTKGRRVIVGDQAEVAAFGPHFTFISFQRTSGG